MGKKIERYAYFPMWSDETKSYYFEKLKVIKVWVRPIGITMFDINSKPYELIYVLENCYRIIEECLITNIDGLCPKQKIIDYRNSYGVKRYNSIFTPYDENYYRERRELDLMKIESDRLIKECIDTDEIYGEINVNEYLNEKQERNKR